jgi:hypothetical protein
VLKFENQHESVLDQITASAIKQHLQAESNPNEFRLIIKLRHNTTLLVLKDFYHTRS